MTLDVVGIRFVLQALDGPLSRALRARFDLFVADDAAPADLVVTVGCSDVDQILPAPSEGGPLEYQLLTEVRGDRLFMRSYAFDGSFALFGTGAEIRLCPGRAAPGGGRVPFEPPARSIENFLRVALAWKAVERGGLLLHASGVVRSGASYVFFGPSGAGKTTIARMCKDTTLLNDDCILILPDGDGFAAAGVPFKGAEDAGARTAGRFPIAGLFRLAQAPAPSCIRLSPARGASEILSCIPFVTERPEGVDRAFTTIERLVRRVPVFRLEFRKAPDFWPLIEKELAHV